MMFSIIKIAIDKLKERSYDDADNPLMIICLVFGSSISVMFSDNIIAIIINKLLLVFTMVITLILSINQIKKVGRF